MKKKYTYVQFYTLGICLFFFIFYFNLRNYGLPYFVNFDETAHIKSINYFYGFFSNANQDIVEPIYSPLLHFLVTGTIFLIKFIIFSSYSLSEFKDLVFLNPDLLWSYTRLSSLIFSTLSIYLIFLISKKLKISNSFIFLSVTSISLSFFFADISISAGKNAILLFLFLLQYYFFLKYFFKINKFNSKAYIVIAILSTLAWGVNYWAATPGIYSIAILHYKKFSYSKLNKLIPFMIIFIFFGIFTNYIISADKIFHHLFNPEYLAVTDYNEHSSSNRFMIFLDEIIIGINIIRNYEKILLEVFLILFLFVIIVKTRIDKKIIFFNLILISEPLFLFAIADYSDAQLRYFGSAIGLLHILFALILTQKFKNSKFTEKVFLSIVIIIFFSFSEYNKISNILISKQILSNKYNQYEAIDDYKNKNSLFIVHNMLIRENLESLKLYKSLLNKNIIKLNPAADGKNSFEEIEKKITSYVNLSESNLSIVNKNINTFGGEFLIINENLFLFEIMNKFDFVIIHENDSYMQNIFNEKFKLHKVYKSENLIYARNLTTRLRNKQKNEELNKIGPTLYVYKIK